MFGGFTYIPLQTASDFYWIFQVIKRFILLKKKTLLFWMGLKSKFKPRPVEGEQAEWWEESSSTPWQEPELTAPPFWQKPKLRAVACAPVVWTAGLGGRHWQCLHTSVPGAERRSRGWRAACKQEQGRKLRPPGFLSFLPHSDQSPSYNTGTDTAVLLLYVATWAVPVHGPHWWQWSPLCRMG